MLKQSPFKADLAATKARMRTMGPIAYTAYLGRLAAGTVLFAGSVATFAYASNDLSNIMGGMFQGEYSFFGPELWKDFGSSVMKGVTDLGDDLIKISKMIDQEFEQALAHGRSGNLADYVKEVLGNGSSGDLFTKALDYVSSLTGGKGNVDTYVVMAAATLVAGVAAARIARPVKTMWGLAWDGVAGAKKACRNLLARAGIGQRIEERKTPYQPGVSPKPEMLTGDVKRVSSFYRGLQDILRGAGMRSFQAETLAGTIVGGFQHVGDRIGKLEEAVAAGKIKPDAVLSARLADLSEKVEEADARNAEHFQVMARQVVGMRKIVSETGELHRAQMAEQDSRMARMLELADQQARLIAQMTAALEEKTKAHELEVAAVRAELNAMLAAKAPRASRTKKASAAKTPASKRTSAKASTSNPEPKAPRKAKMSRAELLGVNQQELEFADTFNLGAMSAPPDSSVDQDAFAEEMRRDGAAISDAWAGSLNARAVSGVEAAAPMIPPQDAARGPDMDAYERWGDPWADPADSYDANSRWLDEANSAAYMAPPAANDARFSEAPGNVFADDPYDRIPDGDMDQYGGNFADPFDDPFAGGNVFSDTDQAPPRKQTEAEEPSGTGMDF